MKFSDILALAKQGYTPNDIKELIKLSQDDPDEKKDPDDPDEKKNPDDPDEKKDPDDPDEKKDPDDPDEKKDPDLVKKLDDALKEIEKLKKDLKTAQQKNTTKDLNNNGKKKAAQDIVNEAFKNLI